MAKDNGTKERRVSEPPEISFRDRLTAAVEAAPISREELGRRVGRTGAAISQWVNRGDMPDLAVVFKLEDALGLPFGQLVRHHSPDVWAIIEVKAGGNSWHAMSAREKFEAALADQPLNQKQRTLLRETLANYLELNDLRSR